jgi:phosphoribosyl 1,2-cyclic phosphodiesterase
MKICILGSGSSGNSIYMERGGFSLLVDAGLSRRELAARLLSIGVGIESIRAVLVSHEHGDHVRGLAALHRAHGVAVHLNRLTASGLLDRGIPAAAFNYFRTGVDFFVGPFTVHPFPVPHDALDPVGFVVSAAGCRVGIATDLGHPDPRVMERLRGCRALVLESNHDPLLLGNSGRPRSVKERILGGMGHLSNRSAAALLAEVASEALQDIFLAHLSEECNRPELARLSAVRAAEGGGFGHVAVRLSWADRASEVLEYD